MHDGYANILTIAGSDSGGGAGIQADLKTITCLGGYGLSVITALTAQNGAEVRGIQAIPPDFVALQYETVLDGFAVKAAKTGMLSNKEIILRVGGLLATKNFPLVVDPVCVSQSGFKLLEDDAIAALQKHILPLADLLTPNVPEAEALSGLGITDERSVGVAAQKLFSLGAKAVLLKGGHLQEGQAGYAAQSLTDWLCLPGERPRALVHERIATLNNHGTGCTLSAAIAIFLGQGRTLTDSVVLAQGYLTEAMRSGFHPGRIGVGPPNFLGGALGAVANGAGNIFDDGDMGEFLEDDWTGNNA